MKRIYKNKKEGKLGGVCSGVGDYLDIDPVIIRLIFVFSVFVWGAGILIYIILWAIIPTNPNPSNKATPAKIDRNNKLLVVGFIVVSIFFVGHFIQSSFWMVDMRIDYRDDKQYDSMLRERCAKMREDIDAKERDVDSNKKKDVFDKCIKKGSIKHNNLNEKQMMKGGHNPILPFIAGAIFVIVIMQFVNKK
ncbi:MAG: PspC domain-containing protein [Nitrososphaerales archaeon]|nr:PspC domain-containing protein [Nitrososphaerales archaeon]